MLELSPSTPLNMRPSVSRHRRTLVRSCIGLSLFIIATTATGAASDPVERGRYLAAAGNCQSCHTREGGAPYAGGVAFETPLGTLYSTNITPDVQTGLGTWSDGDFLRAMHEGIGDDGEQLYPAFPYTSYTNMYTKFTTNQYICLTKLSRKPN